MMAVAMEVGWRGPELGSPSYSHLKHKVPPATTNSSSSWGGADPQKVLQLMMGQIHEESRPTLDLFGNTSSSPAEADSRDEFVELDPDLPLPSGWEKCLDLKSGKVYYVNRHTGAETQRDPRKQALAMLDVQAAASASPQTRDFLGSKESENEKLGELSGRSAPSFSGREMEVEGERDGSEASLFSSGTREQWGHGWLGSGSMLNEVGCADNGLELKLNLHGKAQQSSVCTLEKVEMALMRSEKMLGKRVASVGRSSPPQADQQLLRSNHSAARVSQSPSTSSSSTSTSSRPSLVRYQLLDKENQNSNKRPASAAASAAVPSMVEAEGEGAKEMVMVGGCKSCLMFVMLSKSNPICPRCGTSAALDFASPVPNKRSKIEGDRRD